MRGSSLAGIGFLAVRLTLTTHSTSGVVLPVDGATLATNPSAY